MKKLLLFSLVLSCGMFTFAQRANLKVAKDSRKIEIRNNCNDSEPTIYSPSALPSKTMKKSVTDVTKVALTSSININTSLVAEQTCLIYNKDLNAIMHSSRSNAAAPVSGNNIITNISLDGGTTWTPTTAIGNGNLHRYPSGVFYNPAGNTTFTNGYSLVAGPRTATAGGWSHNYYSSLKLDGTNLDTQYRPASGTGDLLERDGLTCNDDGIAHISGNQYALNASNYITSYRGDVRKGVFNTGTNKFDWTEQDVTPDIFMNTDGTANVSGTTNMAWSQDGMVGYFYFTGVDNRPTEKGTYTPIIYKTTDAGETWNLMDYVDYTNNPVIEPLLWSTLANPNITKPFFSESDAVVDANNNLHIFALCSGAYSTDPDSLGYTFLNENGAIFEFYTQGTNWNVAFVDTLDTRAPSSTESGYGTGTAAIGWDMRLQASRSVDGNKVFATWTDTDEATFGTSLNLNPDVWAWGRDINSAFTPAPINFTAFSDAWGVCYFSYTSPICMDYNDPSSTFGISYEIPVMITDIKTTNDPTKPVYHYYLQGIKFPGEYFSGVGISESSANNMVVSQNVPNPFTGTTKVEVNLTKSSDLSLVVYNLTGQKVYEQKNGSTPAGVHTFIINSSNLKAGVYYYTVTAGDNKVTKKMIVK